jgi:hypothetical protein
MNECLDDVYRCDNQVLSSVDVPLLLSSFCMDKPTTYNQLSLLLDSICCTPPVAAITAAIPVL